jgi:hypothetical protein
LKEIVEWWLRLRTKVDTLVEKKEDEMIHYFGENGDKYTETNNRTSK